MKPIAFMVAVLLLFTSAAFASPSTTQADSQATSAATPSANATSAYVRFVHASPNASAVDIYLNNEAKATDLKLAEATDFMPITAAPYTIDVRPTGAASSTKPIYTTNLVIAGGVSVNLVAVGLLGATGSKAFKIAEFMSDRGPAQGKARVEFFQTVPNVPTVDVLQDTKPVLTELKFAKQAEAHLNLEPGSYNLELVPTGKTAPAVLDLKNTQVAADTIYTIFIIAQTNSATPQAMILTTNPVEASATLEGTP